MDRPDRLASEYASRDATRRVRRERLTRVALPVAALVAIAATVLMSRDRHTRPPVRIANLTLDDEADLHASSPQGIGLLVSPDGSRIVSQAPRGDRRLFMRNLDQPASMSLPNTELGRVMFISPDGRSVGFSNITALKQISLIDGSVTSVTQTDTITTTATMSADGRIVFSMGLGLWVVSAEGGRPRPLTMLAGSEQSQSVAGFLPDGKTLLFTNWLSPITRASRR